MTLIPDAPLLPPSLQITLMDLPAAPPGPILLLVSGVSALLATLTYVHHLLFTPLLLRCKGVRKKMDVFKRTPELRRHTRQPSITSVHSSTSTTALVPLRPAVYGGAEGSDETDGNRPHFAFLMFGVLALGLICGATVLELLIVHRAKQRWAEERAREVGMRFVFGTLTYRKSSLPSATRCPIFLRVQSLTPVMVVLPIVVLLSLLTAYVPTLHSRYHRSIADIEAKQVHSHSKITLGSSESLGTKISVESISAPRHIDNAPHVPEELTTISFDRPNLASGSNKSEETSGKRESRRSWRSWMGGNVGVAV